MTARKPRVPGIVLLLAAIIFCLGTSEFMIAGILELIATDLGVSIPQAGLLITGFAVGMIVGAPAMALLTLKLPQRTTLLTTAGLFAAAHALSALAPSYEILMASRVIAAVTCGGFWAVASVHAVRVSPPQVVGRSLAALIGGLTVANLLGVPAGTWVGTQFGWRATFWAIAAVTVLATVLIGVLIRPLPQAGPPPQLKTVLLRETRAFRGARIWLALGTTALFQAAVFAAFSYFSPLLTSVAGLSQESVPLVLVGFGVGALAGVTLGGRIADLNLFGNILASLLALALSLGLLWVTAAIPWAAIASIVLVGFSGFSIAGALNARVFQIAGEAPTLAASVNTSAFNVGNALGPAAGGAVIAAGMGFRAPLLAGIALTLAALTLATIAMRRDGISLTRPQPAKAADAVLHEPSPADDRASEGAERAPVACG